MTKEELLRPRFEVIADYPDSGFVIGEIKTATEHPYGGYPKSFYELYPSIFKPLQWWEYRRVEDMPEYIKFTKDYIDFKKGSVYKYSNWKNDKTMIGFITDENDKYGKATVPPTFNQLTPATEEEYSQFKNKGNE